MEPSRRINYLRLNQNEKRMENLCCLLNLVASNPIFINWLNAIVKFDENYKPKKKDSFYHVHAYCLNRDLFGVILTIDPNNRVVHVFYSEKVSELEKLIYVAGIWNAYMLIYYKC